MGITPEHAAAFQAIAHERRILQPCPRCRNLTFDLQGYSYKRFSETPLDFEIVGPVFATFLCICTNCGFVAEHAAHTLGIEINGQTQVDS